MTKTIAFINRTWAQVCAAHQALKLRYRKAVIFEFVMNSSKLFNGWFIVKTVKKLSY